MGKVKLKDLPEKYQKYVTDENRDIITIHDDHARPVTRRDFLAAGLITSTASILAPAFGVMSNKAFGQALVCADDAPAAGVAAMPVFINVNLSGGYAVASNVKPMDAGNQPLTSYSLLGLGATALVPVQRVMGMAWAGGAAQPQSGMLRGILGVPAAAAAIAKTTGAPIWSQSQDDTGNNPLSAIGLIMRAGLAGSVLPYLGGVNDTTGVNQNPAFNIAPAVQPLTVTNLASITNAIGAGNSALGTLSAAQQAGLFGTVTGLTNIQKQNIAAVSGGDTLFKNFGCAVDKNRKLASAAPPPLDPRQDAAYAAIWGLNAASGDSNVVGQAASVRAALMGLAPGAAINLGGYDYHGNPRAQTDGQDVTAGTLIGRILASAEQVATSQGRAIKMIVSVTSDGAVSSGNSTTIVDHNADAGNHGGSLLFAYNSAGAPAASKQQIGAFNNAQGVDGTQLASSAQMNAAVVFANWAKLAGRTDLINVVIPNTFSVAQLDQILYI